jgi:hypothetical protein
MHDRLKLLVTEIRMLGSKDWDEHKVTKKMLRAYAPKNPMLATMIRDKRKFKHMLPMELFNKVQFHVINNLDVSKSIEQSEVKEIALKAEPSKMNESKEKTSKSKKKEDLSDNDSTDEETAMMVKNFKKFMKRRGDKKPVHQRKCYECGEKGHYIANYPHKKNDKEDNKLKDKYHDKEKKYKEKSKEYKKKHGNAHVGEGWESSDDSDKEEVATLAIQAPTPTQRLFNYYSESDDEFPIYLMAQGTKVLNAIAPPSSTPSTSSDIENNLDEEEAELERNMINEFGKKGYKQIKKLMEKLEKRKETLERQEDLLILEKERNLALKKTLVEEKVKVDKLTLDLSSANDSLKRMSKESSLINNSFVNLKNAHSELQERHSSLEVKHKDLEVNFDTLLKNAKTNFKTTHDRNVSTSEGCSRCYSIDIKSCVTNLVKLEEKVKAKDAQIRDLNKLVDMSKAKGKSVFESHPAYKAERYRSIKDGLGFT